MEPVQSCATGASESATDFGVPGAGLPKRVSSMNRPISATGFVPRRDCRTELSDTVSISA